MLYQGQIQKFLLIGYRTAWEKEPTKWFSLSDICSDRMDYLKTFQINEIEDLHPYIVDLHENECVERNRGFFKITKKGRDELDTKYNPNYISQEKKQKIEDRELEQKRHNEMKQIAKDSNKFSKYGTWIALGLGGIGLLVAIFKP
jgi:hypothetical protein